MKKPYEIEHNLIISTEHISKEGSDYIKTSDNIVIDEYEYGYRIMEVEGSYPDIVPKELKKLFKIVRKKKLTWLIIDCDGPVYPWLEVYIE